MLERLRTVPTRTGSGRLRRVSRFVLSAAMAWLTAGHAVTAAEQGRAPAPASAVPSCLNELVDVYLSPLKREEGPPIRTFLKPGPPVHLRLPRRRLRMEGPEGERPDTEDCAQKAFSGYRASYLRESDLANRLGVPYDQARLQDGQFFFSALDADKWRPPVDDSDDRESMARRGAWTVDAAYRGPNLSAKFCLVPPAPAGLCYAHTGWEMTYNTGNVRIYSQAFMAATFGLPQTQLTTQITVADLDRYFAYVRRIADEVIVPPMTPTP